MVDERQRRHDEKAPFASPADGLSAATAAAEATEPAWLTGIPNATREGFPEAQQATEHDRP